MPQLWRQWQGRERLSLTRPLLLRPCLRQLPSRCVCPVRHLLLFAGSCARQCQCAAAVPAATQQKCAVRTPSLTTLMKASYTAVQNMR